jgi:hypothetical protein
MAVAECPNCDHDIQTPAFRFRNSGRKDFECPYCRAKLERKKRPKWLDAVLSGIPVLVVLGAPAKFWNRAYLIVALIPILYGLFHLSRPKLSVITAPINPADEMKRRHSEKQWADTTAFDHFRKKKDEEITELRINPRRNA